MLIARHSLGMRTAVGSMLPATGRIAHLHTATRPTLLTRRPLVGTRHSIPRPAVAVYARLNTIDVQNAAHKEEHTDAHIPEGHEVDAHGGGRAHASFYISNVLPIQLGSWDVRPALARLREETLLEQLAEIMGDLRGRHAFRVESWEVARKDGGIFCHFTYMPPNPDELPRKHGEPAFHLPEDVLPDPTSPGALFLPSLVAAAKKHGGWPSWLGRWWSNFLEDRVGSGRARNEAGHLFYPGETVDVKVTDTTPELRGWQKMAGAGRAWIVRGRQWTEDLSRFPSGRLRVEFDGADVSQEMLYTLFRPYGRLLQIEPPTPVPAGALRFAMLYFSRISPAVTSNNCLHGFLTPTNSAHYDLYRSQGDDANVPLSRLRIYYERPLKAHYIRDWISNHPRIALPIIAFLIGTLSYTFFDPIRAFFVRSEVEGVWDIEQYSAVQFVRDNLYHPLVASLFGTRHHKRRKEEELGRASWRDRLEAEHNIERWLSEYPSTFIVVTGPPGSGKHDLVDEVIKREKKPVLIIDCAEMARAKSDSALVTDLSNETGYWPVFSFLQSINGLIDLASVGLIGQKAGFSTPIDQQLRSMLEIVGNALKDVSSHAKKKREDEVKHKRDRRHIKADLARQEDLIKRGLWHDGRLDCIAGNGIMSELGLGQEECMTSDMLPAVEKTPEQAAAEAQAAVQAAKEEKKEENPDDIDNEAESIKTLPIVVLRNFATKPARGDLWTVLAEWGAGLLDNRVAHVIVIGEGSVTTKTLTQALPSKPLNSVSLSDADDYNSLAYVRDKLAAAGITGSGSAITSEPTTGDSTESTPTYELTPDDRADIAKLGGRMIDLELLVYKVRGGQSIREAVDDIVLRNVVELRKAAFGDDAQDAKHLPWTRQQAWKIVTELAKKPQVSYAKLLQDFPFKGAESSLKALEEHELVSIGYVEGRPNNIKPGKPVFREAFQSLVKDDVFRATCQIEYNNAILAKAESEIAKYEDELRTLREIMADGDRLGVGSNGFLGLTSGSAVHQRAQYLLEKIGARLDKIRKTEKDSAAQLKVLA